jgi:hypothetical protein
LQEKRLRNTNLILKSTELVIDVAVHAGYTKIYTISISANEALARKGVVFSDEDAPATTAASGLLEDVPTGTSADDGPY